MLGGLGDDVRTWRRRSQDAAAQRQQVRLGTGSCEDDVPGSLTVAPAVDELGDVDARPLDRSVRLEPERVGARRVAEVSGQVRQRRIHHTGVDRCRHVVVEIDRPVRPDPQVRTAWRPEGGVQPSCHDTAPSRGSQQFRHPTRIGAASALEPLAGIGPATRILGRVREPCRRRRTPPQLVQGGFMSDPEQRSSSSPAVRRASAPAWSPRTGERGWAVVATSRTIQPAERSGRPHRRRRHRRPGHRRPDRRRGPRAVRPRRHPGQQRRRLPRQAVHRVHRRGLRAGVGRQPDRVLPADPAGHRRDAAAAAATSSTSPPPSPTTPTPRARRARRADQGRTRRGDQVARHRVRRARHPGQRRLAGHHPDADAPAGDARRLGPAAPGRARGPGQRRRRRRSSTWRPRRSSPARSCTSTAARAPADDGGKGR